MIELEELHRNQEKLLPADRDTFSKDTEDWKLKTLNQLKASVLFAKPIPKLSTKAATEHRKQVRMSSQHFVTRRAQHFETRTDTERHQNRHSHPEPNMQRPRRSRRAAANWAKHYFAPNDCFQQLSPVAFAAHTGA